MNNKPAFILALIGCTGMVLAGILGLIGNESINPSSACILEIAIASFLFSKSMKYKTEVWLLLIHIAGCSAIIIANIHKMYASYMAYDELPVTSYTMLLFYNLIFLYMLFEGKNKNDTVQVKYKRNLGEEAI